MTAREQAIEAATKTIGRYNEAQWERWRDGPTAQRHREIAAEALAAALPVLLNDLADRIDKLAAKWRVDDRPNHWADGVEDAAVSVRAAAERWGQ